MLEVGPDLSRRLALTGHRYGRPVMGSQRASKCPGAFPLVALVVFALTASAALQPSVASAAEVAAPSRWDPRIRPVAEAVEKLRDLQFERPVKVRFLSDAEFTKRQRSERSDLSKADEAELRRAQGQLRALGIIGQEVDLFEAGNDISSSDVLAYYDPATKRITVKGTGDLDAATRLTVAHELTHALQDQHFDLRKLQREGSRNHAQSAVRTLVEGDAVRIEDLYRDQLSDTDQQAATEQRSSESDAARGEAEAQSIPTMLLALFEAPYAFGPSMVGVADTALDGGVDGLFRHPPATESAFFTPSTLVDDAKFTKVPVPKLGKGEKRVGKPDVFGAFTLFMILASRVDLGQSMRAADGWAGDSMVSFERDGNPCLRARFVGRSERDSYDIGVALDTWVYGRAPEAADVHWEKDWGVNGITLTVCDTADRGPRSRARRRRDPDLRLSP